MSEAKQDKELITAVELASEYDVRCERTMHIYTKFDTFDSEESRNRAVQWVLNGQNLMLGGHAVVAAPGGRAYDSSEEVTHLSELGLPDDRIGIDYLKARLPSNFAKLIATNLPRLSDMIDSKIKSDKKELGKIGEAPNNPMLTVKSCQEHLFKYIPLLNAALSPFITSFQGIVHKTSDKITSEWTAGKFPPNCSFQVKYS